MTTYKSKILTILITILMLFSSIFSLNVFSAKALSAYPFDENNVLDDLTSSADFDINNYPANVSEDVKSPQILNFVEWCYSKTNKHDFALYVYFYNPQGLNIDTESLSNTVALATKYKKAVDNEEIETVITKDSVPTDYETFRLKFCNKSLTSKYNGTFYKFRIIDHVLDDKSSIYERVNPAQRRYDVANLTLCIKNEGAKAFNCGGSFIFTGYAQGYGEEQNNVSTLQCSKFKLTETIELEVNHTNFRTQSSSLGQYHQNELSSVYFSVPEKYFTEYGSLQKIKAEWYEYKTTPIIVSPNQKAYDELFQNLGVYIGAYTNTIDNVFWHDSYDGKVNYLHHCYNFPDDLGSSIYNGAFDKAENSNIETLYYVFKSNDGEVSSEEVLNHIYTYNKTFDKGVLNVGGRQISLDLFEATVDEGRQIGYNVKEIDANDTFDLLS